MPDTLGVLISGSIRLIRKSLPASLTYTRGVALHFLINRYPHAPRMPRSACQLVNIRHKKCANLFSQAQRDLLENLLDPAAHDRDCAEFRLNLARLENLRRKLREEYKRIARSRRDEGTAVATLARQIEILDLVHARSVPTAETGVCYSDDSNE